MERQQGRPREQQRSHGLPSNEEFTEAQLHQPLPVEGAGLWTKAVAMDKMSGRSPGKAKKDKDIANELDENQWRKGLYVVDVDAATVKFGGHW